MLEEKIDTLTRVIMEMKEELKNLKDLKEDQKSHEFLMVSIIWIFDPIVYILITLFKF